MPAFGVSRLVPVDPDQSHASLKRGRSHVARQLGTARFTREIGRYLPVNILDSGRSGRLVRVCAEFQSIGAANRLELVYLDKPGVTIYGWGASLVTDARACAMSAT